MTPDGGHRRSLEGREVKSVCVRTSPVEYSRQRREEAMEELEREGAGWGGKEKGGMGEEWRKARGC